MQSEETQGGKAQNSRAATGETANDHTRVHEAAQHVLQQVRLFAEQYEVFIRAFCDDLRKATDAHVCMWEWTGESACLDRRECRPATADSAAGGEDSQRRTETGVWCLFITQATAIVLPLPSPPACRPATLSPHTPALQECTRDCAPRCLRHTTATRTACGWRVVSCTALLAARRTCLASLRVATAWRD
jgi:hypothetical protein